MQTQQNYLALYTMTTDPTKWPRILQNDPPPYKMTHHPTKQTNTLKGPNKMTEQLALFSTSYTT